MWLDNLKELKKQSGLSSKQIAAKAKLPERTVVRIFAGETDNPYVDTIHRIVGVFNASLDDVLTDTKAVVATESVVELKEAVSVVEAKNDLVSVENEMLKAKNAALATEIELLKKELTHKEELLALHNYYKAYIEQLLKRNAGVDV